MDESKSLKKKQNRRLILALLGVVLILFCGISVYNQIIVTIVKKEMGELLSEVSANGRNMMEQITGFIWLVGILIAVAVILMLSFIIKLYHQKGSKMEEYALFDKLTGLPNWRQMQELAAHLPDKGEDYACVLFHINGFRRINTEFGFEAGGRLLKDIGQLVSNMLEEKEYICRISEDYFSALLICTEKGGFGHRLDEIFEKIGKLPVRDNKITYSYHCTVTGGVCLMKDVEPGDISAARERARTIIESYAKAHLTRWRFFDEDGKTEMAMHTELERDIVRALNEKEFIPYFQPQYHLKTGSVMGAELYARWKHPEKGIIFPGHFIPVLERAGLILDLDMNMLEAACRLLKSWLDQGLMPVPLTVNISGLNLYRQDFPDRVQSMMLRYRIPANLLAIEITERVLDEDSGMIQALIRQLKQMGFLIIMDDSGAGRISLETLQKIPLDYIKMDKEFILNSTAQERNHVVLIHLIELACALNITIVAKGVETEEQLEQIKDQGCEIAQGRLFAEPMGEEDFIKEVFR